MPIGSRVGGAGISGGVGCCGLGEGVVGCGSEGCGTRGSLIVCLRTLQSDNRMRPTPFRRPPACVLRPDPLYGPVPAKTGAKTGRVAQRESTTLTS